VYRGLLMSILDAVAPLRGECPRRRRDDPIENATRLLSASYPIAHSSTIARADFVPATTLVSRFRTSPTFAAPCDANLRVKGDTSNSMILVPLLNPKFATIIAARRVRLRVRGTSANQRASRLPCRSCPAMQERITAASPTIPTHRAATVMCGKRM